MAISELVLDVLCSGEDGSAAGAVLSSAAITGQVKSVHLERTPGGENTAMPDSNTVLITATGPPKMVLLNIKGKTEDDAYSPKAPIHHVGGEPILYDGVSVGGDDFSLVGSKVQAEVNYANNGDRVTARVRYE